MIPGASRGLAPGGGGGGGATGAASFPFGGEVALRRMAWSECQVSGGRGPRAWPAGGPGPRGLGGPLPEDLVIRMPGERSEGALLGGALPRWRHVIRAPGERGEQALGARPPLGGGASGGLRGWGPPKGHGIPAPGEGGE